MSVFYEVNEHLKVENTRDHPVLLKIAASQLLELSVFGWTVFLQPHIVFFGDASARFGWSWWR